MYDNDHVRDTSLNAKQRSGYVTRANLDTLVRMQSARTRSNRHAARWIVLV